MTGRKRGRPKGSRNKPKLEKPESGGTPRPESGGTPRPEAPEAPVTPPKRGRGRPKGSKNQLRMNQLMAIVASGASGASGADDADGADGADGTSSASSTSGDIQDDSNRIASIASTKAKFLRALERNYNMTPSAREAGISASTLYRWIKSDPEFASQIEASREMRMHVIEEHLLKLGFGMQDEDGRPYKGNPVALLAWLNAHHPNYGRIRTEILNRLLGSFVERIAVIARKYIPRDSAQSFGEELARAMEQALLSSIG